MPSLPGSSLVVALVWHDLQEHCTGCGQLHSRAWCSAAQDLPRWVKHPWPLCHHTALLHHSSKTVTLAQGCWGHVCLSLCSLDGGLPKQGAFQEADLKKSKTQAALKVPPLRHFHQVLAGMLVLPAKLPPGGWMSPSSATTAL